MKPDDVPDELLQAALGAFFNATGPGVRDDWRAALAAVIPLIEAREREACAEPVAMALTNAYCRGALGSEPYTDLDVWRSVSGYERFMADARRALAAIRTRGERT